MKAFQKQRPLRSIKENLLLSVPLKKYVTNILATNWSTPMGAPLHPDSSMHIDISMVWASTNRWSILQGPKVSKRCWNGWHSFKRKILKILFWAGDGIKTIGRKRNTRHEKNSINFFPIPPW